MGKTLTHERSSMKRRDFIATAFGTAGFAMASGCANLGLGGKRMGLACQLWSIKDIWEKCGDITSVFPDLAAMGYEGVQSMAFWKQDADKLEKALAANSLVIADMPINFGHVETDEALAKTVAFCKRFGIDFVYVPWWKPQKTIAGWRDFVKRLDEASVRLAPYGIRVGYHHHLHEFADNVDGVYPADVFIAHPTFNFELDVRPILEAGRDPAQVLGQLSGRVPSIHAKPYPGTFAGAPDDRQNWPAIIAAACATGTKWLVVECEQRKNTFDDVKASATYFRSLLATY